MANSRSVSDDLCHDAWHRAFMRTWFDLEEEGYQAAKMLSDWSGRKTSTIYDWKNQEAEPADPWMVLRLAKRASEKGYDHLVEIALPGSKRLAKNGEATVTGSVWNDIRDLDHIQVKIEDAEEAGNGHAMIEGGQELIKKGYDVIGEGRRHLESTQNGQAAPVPQASD